MSNTFKIEPYSYIINLTSNESLNSTHTLPSGNIHFEIKQISDISINSINHEWYGEVKYISSNDYFLLYSTTDRITDDNTLTPNYLYISIYTGSIKLTNKYNSAINLQITILS